MSQLHPVLRRECCRYETAGVLCRVRADLPGDQRWANVYDPQKDDTEQSGHISLGPKMPQPPTFDCPSAKSTALEPLSWRGMGGSVCLLDLHKPCSKSTEP
jgi:hypothetical protein